MVVREQQAGEYEARDDKDTPRSILTLIRQDSHSRVGDGGTHAAS